MNNVNVNTSKFWLETDLTFSATALLVDEGISLEKVTFKDQLSGKKLFWLSPRNKAEQIYYRYVSGLIKINPLDLRDRINALKNIRAETGVEP